MKTASVPFVISSIILLATSACLATLPEASIPATFTPDLMLTGQVQTLAAAPTLTYTPTIIPESPTPTITRTPYPTITPLPSATATFTETPYGFVASPTLGTPDLTPGTATPDPADGVTDEWGSDYRCNLIDKDPRTGTSLPSKSIYKVAWTLYNSGIKRWQASDIQLVYIDGPKMGTTEKYQNITKDVKTGASIKVLLDIVLPKDSGNYRSIWGLRLVKTKHVFCTFTINVTVP